MVVCTRTNRDAVDAAIVDIGSEGICFEVGAEVDQMDLQQLTQSSGDAVIAAFLTRWKHCHTFQRVLICLHLTQLLQFHIVEGKASVVEARNYGTV